MAYEYQRSTDNRYPHWFVSGNSVGFFFNHVYPWLKDHLGPHMTHGGRYRADHQMVRICNDDDAFEFRMRWG